MKSWFAIFSVDKNNKIPSSITPMFYLKNNLREIYIISTEMKNNFSVDAWYNWIN